MGRDQSFSDEKPKALKWTRCWSQRYKDRKGGLDSQAKEVRSCS